MHYWSKCAGSSVFCKQNNVGYIENMMINQAKKTIIAFILEKRNTDIKYRYIPLIKSKKIERDGITIEIESDIKALPNSLRKKYVFVEDVLKKPIMDNKGKWVGEVVDFAFDKTSGNIQELIISESIMQDLWLGRRKMPVLNTVEFSEELIRIDKDTKEEIKRLQKGLKNWFNEERM